MFDVDASGFDLYSTIHARSQAWFVEGTTPILNPNIENFSKWLSDNGHVSPESALMLDGGVSRLKYAGYTYNLVWCFSERDNWVSFHDSYGATYPVNLTDQMWKTNFRVDIVK
jgi:hypothetical protein